MKTVSTLLVIVSALSALGSDAEGEAWSMHSIDPAIPIEHLSGADGVRLGDIDGDGRLDIVTGWEEGKSIRICLQPGKDDLRKPWPSVTVGRVDSAEDAVFADLDGNGRLDVVSATEGKDRTLYVHWAPDSANDLLNPDAWSTEAFPETENRQWWMYTLPLDVDGDGDVDLVVGSKNAGASISWLENPGGEKSRDLGEWKLTRLAEAGWIMSIREFESNGQRFLCYSDRKGKHSGVWILPLLDESPWFGTPIQIGVPGEEVMFLDLAHLDDDDRFDVVAVMRPDRMRVLYQPENPKQPWPDYADFDPVPMDAYGTLKAVRVGRIDGDETPDVVVTCERADRDKVGVFWSNLHSELTPISDSVGIKYDRIELLDLDSDGDLDVITCEERAGLGVIWFENPSR